MVVRVPLRSILQRAGVEADATHITVTASDGEFSASVPLVDVADALLVYELEEEPLPVDMGGPFRFLIPNVGSCASAAVDACANVKYVARLTVSKGPGRDTRPSTRTDHEALHRVERCSSKD